VEAQHSDVLLSMLGTPAMWGLYTACKHKLNITSATPTTGIREGSEDFKPSARR